ncbi:cysteine hydrolase family protein [Sporosarcina sp. FSL W7-1283]|uniref:cysteine hydrolase family protein n=1 Tax=Sporosarcina sp. FSL W7-1283 TaxID=2921560 RepID=UPI0030FAC87B
MMELKKALLVVDYTVDFVAIDGALTCGEPGIALENHIVQLTKDFLAQQQPVFVINDLHEKDDPYHPENALFPAHNIRGTFGRNLYGKMHDLYSEHSDEIIWMDKTRYSAFAGTDLDIQLRARDIREIHLTGVCTDICILHTAIDAYNLGYKVFIHEGGVASFNPAGHDWALSHFQNTLGATVISN